MTRNKVNPSFRLILEEMKSAFFSITVEILSRSLANFHCQEADRHEFKIQVQFVTVKTN